MKYVVSLLCVSILCLCACGTNFNPYHVLEVSRSASSADIRKAYKKLVKEWHPDKNNSPDAQDRFIEIQQAYEILSNEEKRNDYDHGGFNSDNNHQWTHHSQHFKFSDMFRNDFGFEEGDARSVSYHKFYNRVLPDSRHTPQVLYVYSTFCAPCIAILRSSWEKSAKALENLSVGVGTVDTTFTSRIAVNLRVSKLPTTVLIFEEQYYYHQGAVSPQSLKDFVVSNLPQHLVESITSKNLASFLTEIHNDDKPRVLLFSKQPQPTLLYTIMAIKHQRYFKFGFVSLSSSDPSSVAKQFGVVGGGPVLLIFKEDLQKPAVRLQSSDMPRGAINDALSSNRYMTVPRITSQEVFDDICPSQHDQSRNVQFCVIFAVGAKQSNFLTPLNNLRKVVAAAFESDEQLHEWLKIMYVVTSKQQAFVRSLSGLESAPEQSSIYLVWRRSSNRGFSSTYSSHFLDSKETLNAGFQKLVSMALRTTEQQQFERRIRMSSINDELAPFILIRIMKSVKVYSEKLIRVLKHLNDHETMLLYVSCFIIFLSIYSVLGGNKREGRRRDPSQRAREPSCSEDTDVDVEVAYDDEEEEALHLDNLPLSVKELQPHTYEDLVLRQRRGHLTISLLLSENDSVMEDFAKVVMRYERDPKLHFCYLNLSMYLSWYVGLRKASSAQPPDSPDLTHPTPESGLSSLRMRSAGFSEEGVCPSRVHGTVLAMNGSKHWYCIFIPRNLRSRSVLTSVASSDCVTSSGIDVNDVSLSAGDRNVKAPNACENEQSSATIAASALAANSEPVSEPRDGANEYRQSLMHWLDRVCEGHFPRLYLRQWPGLYLRSATDSDDED